MGWFALFVVVVLVFVVAYNYSTKKKTFGLKEAAAAKRFITDPSQVKPIKAVIVGVLGYTDEVTAQARAAKAGLVVGAKLRGTHLQCEREKVQKVTESKKVKVERVTQVKDARAAEIVENARIRAQRVKASKNTKIQKVTQRKDAKVKKVEQKIATLESAQRSVEHREREIDAITELFG